MMNKMIYNFLKLIKRELHVLKHDTNDLIVQLRIIF